MDLVETLLKVSQAGSVALLLFALFGAYKGWWVPGRTYDEAVRREASWKEMYEREKAAREEDRDKERRVRG